MPAYLGPVNSQVGLYLSGTLGRVASCGTREPSNYQTSQILRDLLYHAEEFGLFEGSYRRGDRVVFVF